MALSISRCISLKKATFCCIPIIQNVVELRSSLHTSGHLDKKQATKNQKGKNVTAQGWVNRQINDPYVKRARYESYRCRSAFKLLEIDEKHKIMKPGDVVIDCGAAPGSWCEVAVKKVNSKNDTTGEPVGKVIGVDIQHMSPLDGAIIFCQSDFTDINTQKKILEILGGRKADLVLSDMAPKASGLRSMDHELIVNLCTTAFRFSVVALREGGTFLGKILQGAEQPRLESMLRVAFKEVKVVKPPASRTDSAEIFLLARDFRGLGKPK